MTDLPPDVSDAADPGYLLTAYADGQLHEEGVRLVEERLRGDPLLRARLAEIRLLQGLLRTGLAHQPDPARLDSVSAGRILARAARPRPVALRSRPPRRWALAAMVFLAVIGLPLMTMLAILGLPLSKLKETLGNGAAGYATAEYLTEGHKRLRAFAGSERDSDSLASQGSVDMPVAAPAAKSRFSNSPSPAPAPLDAPVVSQQLSEKDEGKKAKSKVGESTFDVVEEAEHPAPDSPSARGERGKQEGFGLGAAPAVGGAFAPSTPATPQPVQPDPKFPTPLGGAVSGMKSENIRAPGLPALVQAQQRPAPSSSSAMDRPNGGQDRGQAPAAALEAPAESEGSSRTLRHRIESDRHTEALVDAPVALGLSEQRPALNAQPELTELELAQLMARRQLEFGAHKNVTEDSEKSDDAPAKPQQGSAGGAGGIGYGKGAGGINMSSTAFAVPVLKQQGIGGKVLDEHGGMASPSAPKPAANPAKVVSGEGGLLIERQRDLEALEDEHADNGKTDAVGGELRALSPPDRLGQNQAGKLPKQQLHDVRDLERDLEFFPSPDLSIPEPGDGKSRALKQEPGMSGKELAEVIKKVVAPERWKEPGVGITEYNGALVVSGDAELQRQVGDLLTTLRKQLGGRRAGADGTTPAVQSQQAMAQQSQAAMDSDQLVVAAVRPNPQGQADLVMLTCRDGDTITEGDEYRIERDGRDVVTVRVEKLMNDMLACRILPETWIGSERQLQSGDVAARRIRPALERLGGIGIETNPSTLAQALGERVSFNNSGDLASLLRAAGGAHIALRATPLIAEQLDQPTSLALDATRAQGLLQLVRGAGLQARLGGGALTIDRARGTLDPTDLYGFERERFRAAFGTAPMTSTREDAHSTFALSADTATYDLARHQLRTGHPVDPLSIQPEHFINAMPMDYPVAHTDEAFALYAEAAPSPFAAPGAGLTEGPGDAQRAPWSARTALVAIGAVARPAGSDERRPLHLTLAIDCSGSMAQEGGLTRIQVGLAGLIDHLKAEDRLALVAFGDQARVVLPATAGNEHARLLEAVNELTTGGATNVAEGLSLAYQLANESLDSGVESRVVLCTDGGTLVGEGAPAVVARISTYRQRGITLLVLGCGGTAYQAGPLEQLASQGGGQHVFLASDAEARTAFAGRLLPERLAVLARDAKVQVTWNPERVSHYRLIGYEGRRLAHRDFRNDAVAAGQLSGDTQVTALYEVLLVEGASGPLGTAAVRYFDTRMQSQRELSCPLPGSVLTSQPSPRLRLLACAGECAEWLQRGWWSNVHAANAERILAELKRCSQAQARELELLILRAQRLQAQGGQERSLPPGSGQAQDGSR